MSRIFLHLVNVSITAGWIVLVVVLLRVVLKKAPKWSRVVLWGLVALRLMVPVTVESVMSLVPSAETVQVEPTTYVTSPDPERRHMEREHVVIRSGFPALNSAVNPVVQRATERVDTMTRLKTVAGWLWLAGVVGMLLYAFVSYLRVRRRVRPSIMTEPGVYACDEVSDPFILGVLRPQIYLPSGMDGETGAYVLAHERAHIRRLDHLWKPLGFLLLSVYWFNPLLWLAYVLLCRDIELACDEKVVKDLSPSDMAAYSEALLTVSVSRRTVAACPLAFGEVGVKARVSSILNYKKPAFWLILAAILACVAVAVCFLTMPKKKQSDADFVGTWEYFKTVTDTYEEDFSIQAMLGMIRYEIVFREDGTGIVNLAYDSGAWETPFTYTVSGNTLTARRTDFRGEVELEEYIYEPLEGTLHALVAEGEGNHWVGYFVRKGTVTYPSIQLTIDQVAGQWKSDGHPVTKGRAPSLSGTLSLDRAGRASLHLYGDEGTEMTASGTYSIDGSLLQFEPDEAPTPLKYHPWLSEEYFVDLGMMDIHPTNETAATASYDPKTDTLRFYHWEFGVLTFYRDGSVTQGLEKQEAAFPPAAWSEELHTTVSVGEVPEAFREIIEQNLFGNTNASQFMAFSDRVLTYGESYSAGNRTVRFDIYDLYGHSLLQAETILDPCQCLDSVAATTDGGLVFASGFNDSKRPDGTWESQHTGVVSYIVKLDANGDVQWKTELNGINGYALHICIEQDGAYYFFGDLEAPETDKPGVRNYTDLYLLKIGADGSVLKERRYGGSDFDMIWTVDTCAEGFVIDAMIQSTDGDFPASASRDWRVVVDGDLELLHKEPIENVRLSSCVGFVEGKRIYTDDPRFTAYPDGRVHGILDYGAFELVLSENNTGVYERQPPTISSIWYYTETVYAAYDKKGDLLWKTAVDSSPDYDAWRTALSSSAF